MTRLFLSSYPERRPRQNRRRSARSSIRRLSLERLDARLVLSGMPDAINLDASGDAGVDPQPAAAEAQLEMGDVASMTSVVESQMSIFLTEDGVLQVQPNSENTTVTVRQFVDYQLQEVIEIEAEGQWRAFPAAQVKEVLVETLDVNQDVDIAAGVTTPVRLIETVAIDQDGAASVADPIDSDLVDAAIADSAYGDGDNALLPETMTVTYPATPLESGPEGEMPGGMGMEPQLVPPYISNFRSERDGNIWRFSGTVGDDNDVNGLQVRFGGLLDGTTLTVDTQGYFEIVVALSPDAIGMVSAVTTDHDGLDSNTVYCIVN